MAVDAGGRYEKAYVVCALNVGKANVKPFAVVVRSVRTKLDAVPVDIEYVPSVNGPTTTDAVVVETPVDPFVGAINAVVRRDCGQGKTAD